MVILIAVYENMFVQNIGINRIEAFLQHHDIEVRTLYIKSDTEINHELLSNFEGASLVGISLYASSVDFGRELTRKIKERNRGTIVCYGSQFVTGAYLSILERDKWVDFLVLGHGEKPLLNFISNYNGSNMRELIQKNSCLVSHMSTREKKPYKVNINKVPWPNQNRKIIKRDLFAYLNTSHGCYGNCSFCGYLRNKWSGRNPKEIIQEMINLEEKYGVRAFSFADNSIEDPGELGKKRLYELCDYIINSGRRFALNGFLRAETMQDTPDDRRLLKKMRQAGFNQLLLGIEAGNDEDLSIYNKRATLEDNRRALRLLQEYDITPFFGFIMLNPYSTKQKLLQNYQFLIEQESYFPGHYMNYLMVYKTAPIYKRINQEGLLIQTGSYSYDYKVDDEYGNKIYTFIKSKFINSELSGKVLNMQNYIKMINYMFGLLDQIEEEQEYMEQIKRILFKCNQQYFRQLYIDDDFEAIYYSFNDYASVISQYENQMNGLVLTLIKRYCKKYNG